jgi:hypothetical protein
MNRIHVLACAATLVACSAQTEKPAIPVALADTVAARHDSAPPAQPARTTEWVVRPDSFGPVPLGAPIAQAAAALGQPLTPSYMESDMCSYARGSALPPRTHLMVTRDSVTAPEIVMRVDIDTTGIRTAEGAGVGDTEARLLELYGSRARVSPHFYVQPNGHYVTVPLQRDTMFQLIFETIDGRVTTFRAGKLPAVRFIEGCA